LGSLFWVARPASASQLKIMYDLLEITNHKSNREFSMKLKKKQSKQENSTRPSGIPLSFVRESPRCVALECASV
jgi:hypothetical protein